MSSAEPKRPKVGSGMGTSARGERDWDRTGPFWRLEPMPVKRDCPGLTGYSKWRVLPANRCTARASAWVGWRVDVAHSNDPQNRPETCATDFPLSCPRTAETRR